MSHNRHEDFASSMLTIISIDREATPQRKVDHNQIGNKGQERGVSDNQEALSANVIG